MKKNKLLRNNNSFKKLYLFPLILITCFLVVTMFVACETITQGIKLSQLEKEEQKLSDTGRELKEALTKSDSLISLTQKAEELGFKKPENIIYIKESSVFASKIP